MSRERSTPKPLTRSLGVWGVLFLTLSITTPASSVFVIAPDILQNAGTGAVWAMLVAGIVSVAVSYVYAELSSAWPVAGGEYVFVGQALGPAAGFAMLFVNLVSNILIAPVLALGIASMLSTFVDGVPVVPLAVAVLAGATLVGIFNIRLNAWLTGVFLAVEVLALIVIMILGFVDPAQSAAAFLHPFAPTEEGGMAPLTLAGFGTATSIAIFALNGPGCAIYFGEEMHDPARKLSRAILLSSLMAIFFIGLPVLAGLVGAPDLASFLASDDPFDAFIGEKAGPVLAAFLSAGVVLAIINAIIASILACARFLYGSARDRSWNLWIDEALGTVHPRFGSPWLGTLIVGAISIACCFVDGTFLALVSGQTLIVIYGGIAVAALVARRRGMTAHAPYRMPLSPWPAVVTLVALAGVLLGTALDVEEGQPALLALAVQIVLALLYYKLVLARRGWRPLVPAEDART